MTLIVGGVVAAAMIAMSVVHVTVGKDALTSVVKQTLGPALTLGVQYIDDHGDQSPDSLAAQLADLLDARVTLLWSDGEVAGDSDVLPQERVAHLVIRPEVAGAVEEGEGFARRRSTVTGREYVFAARAVQLSSGAAVLRIGVLTDDFRHAQRAFLRSVLLTLLFVGVLGGVVAALVARGVVNDLGRAATAADQIAGGQAPQRQLPSSVVDEVDRVLSSLNHLGNELKAVQALSLRERDEVVGLMDQIAEGLLALTDDARVLRINPAAKRLLGIDEVPPFAPIGSLVRDPKLRPLLEYSVIKEGIKNELIVDGKNLQITTRRLDNGGSVVLLMDVTEIRRLEAVRTDFVAAASHELKTPLTVIRGAAETVMDDDLPPHLRTQFLGSIHGNAVRLQRLVDDLLDLSRFESGSWRPNVEEADVEVVAEHVWNEVLPSIGSKAVRFEVEGHGTALADESALYQIFQNLFDNAVRYTPEEGASIRVNIRELDSKTEVAVTDNGTGIPKAELPRIFERFYRVDAARSRAEGGTGLGLAIVRHLVSSMGGTIRAESELGTGTTIRFVLPRVPDQTTS